MAMRQTRNPNLVQIGR